MEADYVWIFFFLSRNFSQMFESENNISVIQKIFFGHFPNNKRNFKVCVQNYVKCFSYFDQYC